MGFQDKNDRKSAIANVIFNRTFDLFFQFKLFKHTKIKLFVLKKTLFKMLDIKTRLQAPKMKTVFDHRLESSLYFNLNVFVLSLIIGN